MNLTVVFRLSDSTPLCSYAHTKVKSALSDMKELAQHLTSSSLPKRSVSNGSTNVHYLISGSVIYMVSVPSSFSSAVAMSYLQSVQSSFASRYSTNAVSTAAPYSLAEFEQELQRAAQDAESRTSLLQLQSETEEVRDQMAASLQEIIGRGNKLSEMEAQSEALVAGTHMVLADAKQLDIQAWWRLYGTYVVVGAVILLIILLKILL